MSEQEKIEELDSFQFEGPGLMMRTEITFPPTILEMIGITSA